MVCPEDTQSISVKDSLHSDPHKGPYNTLSRFMAMAIYIYTWQEYFI
jgi:hypothetical protein